MLPGRELFHLRNKPAFVGGLNEVAARAASHDESVHVELGINLSGGCPDCRGRDLAVMRGHRTAIAFALVVISPGLAPRESFFAKHPSRTSLSGRHLPACSIQIFV
jgi:hypothetical protein